MWGRTRHWLATAALLCAVLLLPACDGGDDDHGATSYTVGGTLSGLGSGLSVTLLNNGSDALTRNANGAFTFATALASGTAYAVTVGTQPTGQTCTVSNGSGTITSANVTSVTVVCATPPAWAWQGGSKLVAPAGIYGTKGVPSAANAPGGRNWQASWVDTQGQFWIFGGQGYDSFHSASALNDLWRYDRLTREWTWMSGSDTINAIGFYGTKGVAAASNVPGAREFMATWVDDDGDFWLFGGFGFDGYGNLGYLNDLWRYQPSRNLWTWMGGSNLTDSGGVYGTLGVESATNQPGARWGAVALQFHAGKVWMFGGYGVDSNGLQLGYLNDLWTYNPANGRWTWVSGSSTFGATAVYGTKGVAAAGNVPGARSYTMLVPTDGAVWIFGGLSVDAANAPIAMNDLWRYDINSGQWTWVSGANVPNSPGVYGTKGMPAAANVPGARGGMVGWSEPYIWVFGGAGYDSVGNGSTDLNDLWRFDPQTGLWTWMSGSNVAGAKGVYGTLGVPSTGNVPGARDSGTVFHDRYFTGHAWLFGGAGYDSTGTYDAYGLNDLWELVMD